MGKKHPYFVIGIPSWQAVVYVPDLPESSYLGTRFDRAGVFGSLKLYGREFCAPWLEADEPLRHDNVQGPAEEFGEAFFDEAKPGETFLKIGVGLLVRPDDAPYDHFRLYEVADAGRRENTLKGRVLTMRHVLDGVYDYSKVITLGKLGEMTIAHMLTNTGSRVVSSHIYNHNFFTFNSFSIRSGREVEFPYIVTGVWREAYDSVLETPARNIGFTRKLRKGESVFCGGLHSLFDEKSPYDFRILHRGTGMAVQVNSPAPYDRANFWANHRVACFEPFVDFRIAPGETFRQEICYQLSM